VTAGTCPGRAAARTGGDSETNRDDQETTRTHLQPLRDITRQTLERTYPWSSGVEVLFFEMREGAMARRGTGKEIRT